MGKLPQAVKSQNIGDVKRLLRTESPNDKDNYHQTPLHLSCGVAANLEITKLLLKKKLMLMFKNEMDGLLFIVLQMKAN